MTQNPPDWNANFLALGTISVDADWDVQNW